MSSVNKAILIGNLGKDPEIRYLPSGEAVANFSIATSEKWKDKAGEVQEQTEWHRITFFGRHAEVCGEYLRKGAKIYVEGKIQTRKWKDRDGNDRFTTEIRGDRLQMLGGKRDSDEGDAASGGVRPERDQAPEGERQPGPAKSSNNFDDLADDVPF